MRIVITILVISHCLIVNSQESKPTLHYYLPKISYDANIPTPEQFLGYQIGEWHVSHDQLVSYIKALDAASDRIEVQEYARTYENRPLLLAMISSPNNLKKKEEIKKQHQLLSDANTAANVDISKLPLVLWQGYTIHGNEPSGNNAALLVAYYLAAGQGKEIDNLLENTLIMLDPCLNPDGAQRFSTWVNSHKSSHLVSDPSSREFSEVWPGGRYNHYWFDMNRDWLLLIHPESRGRVKLLHEWHPNVLTDHHEMGTNSTFFFMPGIPSSNNPNTPVENFVLTEEIAKFHAKALDSIGSLYYTKTNFDDFYYGKGSTYPDAIGAMGILFEQASSRGHLQESVNGPVSFPFTIRNQVNTSLSTHKAVVALMEKILKYKQTFHSQIIDKVKHDAIKAYIFTDEDQVKLNAFIHVLLQHHIDVYPLEMQLVQNDKTFSKGKSFFVPLQQNQAILAKTIFEEVKSFRDSSFYDVSGWTMSYAYGLTVEPINTIPSQMKKPLDALPVVQGELHDDSDATYAYIIPCHQYNFHRAVYLLQSKGVRVNISQKDLDNGQQSLYKKGSAVVAVYHQKLSPQAINLLMKSIATEHKLHIFASNSGFGTQAVTLGHPSVKVSTMPRVAFICGNGISPQSAGEVWHHFDLNLALPATMLEINRLRSVDLKKYNTLIMPAGSYQSWGEDEVSRIKEWVSQGNTLICIGNALKWAMDKKLISLVARNVETPSNISGVYEYADREADAKQIGGSILSIDVDTTHPIFWGIDQDKMYVMQDDDKFYEPTTNRNATPAKYSDVSLASGYLPMGMDKKIKGGANVTAHQLGNGQIICFHTDPLFRGYWLSGQKLMNNAIFNASLIDRKTLEPLTK
jgi:hypothetical protein